MQQYQHVKKQDKVFADKGFSLASANNIFNNAITYSRTDIMIVDLHDLPLDTAKALVRYCCMKIEPSKTNKCNTLIVITGKCNHMNNDGARGVLRKEIEIP